MRIECFDELTGRGTARRPSDGGEARGSDAAGETREQQVLDPRLLVGLRETLSAGVSPAWLATRLARVIDGVENDCGARADPRLLQGLQASQAGGMSDKELANRLGGLIDVMTGNLKRGGGC